MCTSKIRMNWIKWNRCCSSAFEPSSTKNIHNSMKNGTQYPNMREDNIYLNHFRRQSAQKKRQLCAFTFKNCLRHISYEILNEKILSTKRDICLPSVENWNLHYNQSKTSKMITCSLQKYQTSIHVVMKISWNSFK